MALSLTPDLLGKLVGAAVAAAVGAGAGVAAATRSSASLEGKVDQALARITTIESDLRLLRCRAGFREGCPADGKVTPP